MKGLNIFLIFNVINFCSKKKVFIDKSISAHKIVFFFFYNIHFLVLVKTKDFKNEKQYLEFRKGAFQFLLQKLKITSEKSNPYFLIFLMKNNHGLT